MHCHTTELTVTANCLRTKRLEFGACIYNWIGRDEQCAESFEGLYLLHCLFTINFIHMWIQSLYNLDSNSPTVVTQHPQAPSVYLLHLQRRK